jgi:hypothetical protein
VSLPSTVLKLMGPVVAPAGTKATTWVDVTLFKVDAATPLNRIVGVLALRFAPVIVTAVPTNPKAGAKPEMVGATMKLVAENAEPATVTTLIRPVFAPAGTRAVNWELLRIVMLLEATEPKKTAEAPRKLVPLMTTLVFTRPDAGEKLETAGLP